MADMKSLPIHAVLPELTEALSTAASVILQAPPGAGKTTVVPLELLRQPWLAGKKILLLEPRRLAARNAARRMASILGEKVGETVGYRMRMETKVSSRTRIEVVTEGVLTRMLLDDPALEEAGIVIFDEFHERSLQADLGLALTLQTRQLLRDDLKILPMSATLGLKTLEKVLPDAPVVVSEGRSFNVEHRYLDIRTPSPEPSRIAEAAVKTVLEALEKGEGSLLVFLPGVREIRRAEKLLAQKVKDPLVGIAPLYGDLPAEAQQRAVEPAKAPGRKVVLATNIAETSLTIEGVRVVVDSGLERTVSFDAASGMDRWKTMRISEDSAVQRAGRAGRTQEGVCYRLWHENTALPPHRTPDILTADLAPMRLDIAVWGADPDELPWVDPPPEHALESAENLLISLDMMERNGRITPHGMAAHRTGLHPRFAHMLLRAVSEGLGYEAVLTALLLHESPLRDSEPDMAVRLERLHRMLGSGEKNVTALFRRLAGKFGVEKASSVQSDRAGVLVALAYPERIAMLREGSRNRYLLANGKGAEISENASPAGEPFLAVADAGGAEGEMRIFHAAALDRNDLQIHFSDRIESRTVARWNDKEERVEVRREKRLGALMLERVPVPDPDSGAVVQGIMEGIRRRGLEALPWDKKSEGLRQRVECANRFVPGSFPAMDDASLLESLPQWLGPYLDGIVSFKALRKLDLYAAVSGMLGWDGLRKLDALLPETLTVPSGSKIRIDYSDPETPVLAVRLQEVFGWRETPRVLDGRVPLTLHLLSPAQRPVQVTKDLASFWREGYAEVRRELRGRYKKHYWPEDPLEATATSKTKKGMAAGR